MIWTNDEWLEKKNYSLFGSSEWTSSCIVWRTYNNGFHGVTVEFVGPFGTNKSAEPTMSGGPLVGTYRLANVHFHWGYDNTDGSEHAINSKKLPMEMHFVHYNTDFK